MASEDLDQNEDVTASMGLIEYLNHRRKQKRNLSAIFKTVKIRFQEVAPQVVPGVYLVTYHELCKVWTKWAREARGTYVFLGKDGKFHMLKKQFQRGAELLTGVHKAHQIEETENMSKSTVTRLSPSQQKLANDLANPELVKMDAKLSFKSDGSLTSVSVYFGEYQKMVDLWISKSGNKFAMINQEKSKAKGYTLAIASQKTFFIEDDTYVISSILSTFGIDYSQINSEPSIHHAWERYSQVFFDKIDALLQENGFGVNTELVDCVTMMFEAVCKDMKSATGKSQGLAVSYPFSMFKFLGITVCQDNTYNFRPHFEVKNSVFDEPLWFQADSNLTINAMISDLEKVVFKDMTEEDYLAKYKPGNLRLPERLVFDPEGFVFYSGPENEYNKLKTSIYYIAHKPKKQHAAMLEKILERAGESFPGVTRLKLAELRARKSDEPVDDLGKEVFRAVVVFLANSKVEDFLEGKVLESYSKKTVNFVKWQMLLSSAPLRELVNKEIVRVFGITDDMVEEIIRPIETVRNLVFKVIGALDVAFEEVGAIDYDSSIVWVTKPHERKEYANALRTLRQVGKK